MTIGEYIKKIREEKNLSLNQLALYSGVSAAHLSRIERGLREPSPEVLRKIAAALKVSYEELMKVAGYLDEKPTVTPVADLETRQVENQEWQPQLTEKDKKDIAKTLEEWMKDLTSAEGLAFFNGEPVDEETKEYLKDSFEMILKHARLMNKKKYTPKKYRR
ncbi:Transcriptional regulator, contains XRE-family HTH domain [Thermoanaerobacter uzonensis DSM 18761]|uniref:Transcriptional regulator, contains XRE-family HTH domain n=1 Tax=Thermoanaerobacter uzonensis DSM 18761 TaxID=1123369 RepID=A0A1M5ALL9_9THEO|nr:Transcriptional regulator, contains XRE-family HTH domain [Thermoanaerobacter uzonensis DSM 18761]